MRRKRYIRSGKVYSLTFRVREGLPFVCNKTVNLLIESAVARSQRDNKVSLCHDLWMTNHAHLIAVFYDMNQATKFYMEIKKKVTDYYKKLLGLKKLRLWEEDDSVCEILDLYAAMKQIAYLYSNPATANLVSSIDEYRLVNSWVAFNANISTPLTLSLIHI